MNGTISNEQVHEVLNALQGVRRSSGGWTARCPAHEDQRSSLSINTGDSGSLLLHCHAGCGYKAVLAALPLFSAMPPERKEQAIHYSYEDETGEVLYQAVRRPGKKFFQRSPDGKGGWVNKLTATRRVLFRLPELLAVDGPVWVVEGEKDASRLAAQKLNATCNVGGAGKWRPEYSQQLSGRDVFIIPDNDEPGRKHAELVKKSLEGFARSIEIIELPGVREKGDVSDWLDDGHTIQDLLDLAMKLNAVCAKQKVIDFIRKPKQALLTTGYPTIDRNVGGGLAFGEVCVIAARPSHGKTMFGLQLLHNMSCDHDVAFISLEMSESAIVERLVQYAISVPRDQFESRLDQAIDDAYSWANRRFEFRIAECRNNASEVEHTIRKFAAQGTRIICLDYIQRCYGPGRDEREQVTNGMQIVTKAAKECGVLLICLAQLSREIEKRQSFAPKMSDLGNSGGIERDADLVWFLCWPWKVSSKNHPETYRVFFGKNRQRATIEPVLEFAFAPARQRIEVVTKEGEDLLGDW